MTDTAEYSRISMQPLRLVFMTTRDDALALENALKPADRGWRALLGYAFALPPLVLISWLTRNADWPVWFAAFGLVGVIAWQSARFVLAAERSRAAKAHPTGEGWIELSEGHMRGRVGEVEIDIPASSNVRVLKTADHIHILGDGLPALILPLAAFADGADMTAFGVAIEAGRQRTRSVFGSD